MRHNTLPTITTMVFFLDSFYIIPLNSSVEVMSTVVILLLAFALFTLSVLLACLMPAKDLKACYLNTQAQEVHLAPQHTVNIGL